MYLSDSPHSVAPMRFFDDTFDNVEWLQANEDKLRALIPEVPTEVDMGFFTRLGFQLKLMGVDWREIDEIPYVLARLHLFTFMLVAIEGTMENPKKGMVRRNPEKISQERWENIRKGLQIVKTRKLINLEESFDVTEALLKRMMKS